MIVVEHCGAGPHYWSISRSICEIAITQRPAYCDRGRYLAQVFPRGTFALDFDGQDGWPRYYFDWGRMLAEIEAWLAIREP